MAAAAAGANDAEAMIALSMLVENAGRRIRSYKWLRRAARAGHPAANNKLGMLLASRGGSRLRRSTFKLTKPSNACERPPPPATSPP